ncbi:MAG: hypothetical protein MZV63_46520 [Marinilabiliales bacterium]|nr:hypothetical protein [Marinilabiliales bacterium]
MMSDLICTVDDNVPESIIGDPFRLRQVLTNLLNHSIKNTEKGRNQLQAAMLQSNKKAAYCTLGFELARYRTELLTRQA